MGLNASNPRQKWTMNRNNLKITPFCLSDRDIQWVDDTLAGMDLETKHLQDVPMVKTFINGYTSSEHVVRAVVNKLLGRSPFRGINPVDPFCGYWDAQR
jgi:hypothetical protein